MAKFIQSHLAYPADAISNRIEGRVIVGFTITEVGKVEDIQIQKSLYPACDSAVIALIESMPDWKPAKQLDKKPMLTHNSLPISFDLSAYRKLNGKNCDCLDAIKQTTDTIYYAYSVDTPPSFPGGEAGILQYIARNTTYPMSEIIATSQMQTMSTTKRIIPKTTNKTVSVLDGQVELLFIISPTGKVSCVELTKSLKEAFDDAAIKSIKSMPAWTPGIHNGEAVYTYYTVPLRFRYK